ncbi:MAG: YcxB family protein [Pseudomonadota bacterium]
MESARYAIMEADQIAFNLLHFRASIGRFLLIAAGLVCAIMLIAFAFDGVEAVTSVGIGGVIGMVLMLALVRYLIVPRFARKAWRDFALIREPIEFSAHADGFAIHQPSAHVEATWSNMIAWDEDAKVFAIYVTRQQAYILPKPQIEGDFIDFVRAQLIESGLTKRGARRK